MSVSAMSLGESEPGLSRSEALEIILEIAKKQLPDLRIKLPMSIVSAIEDAVNQTEDLVVNHHEQLDDDRIFPHGDPIRVAMPDPAISALKISNAIRLAYTLAESPPAPTALTSIDIEQKEQALSVICSFLQDHVDRLDQLMTNIPMTGLPGLS